MMNRRGFLELLAGVIGGGAAIGIVNAGAPAVVEAIAPAPVPLAPNCTAVTVYFGGLDGEEWFYLSGQVQLPAGCSAIKCVHVSVSGPDGRRLGSTALIPDDSNFLDEWINFRTAPIPKPEVTTEYIVRAEVENVIGVITGNPIAASIAVLLPTLPIHQYPEIGRFPPLTDAEMATIETHYCNQFEQHRRSDLSARTKRGGRGE